MNLLRTLLLIIGIYILFKIISAYANYVERENVEKERKLQAEKRRVEEENRVRSELRAKKMEQRNERIRKIKMKFDDSNKSFNSELNNCFNSNEPAISVYRNLQKYISDMEDAENSLKKEKFDSRECERIIRIQNINFKSNLNSKL